MVSWTKIEIFGIQPPALLILFVHFRFNQRVIFSYSKYFRPSKEEVKNSELGKIEVFERNFAGKSDLELEKIQNDESKVKEARIAAENLRKKKN